MKITKEFTFSAAHILPWHEGKCKNLHGHTYKLQVTVSGPLDKNGVVMDFADIKKVVKAEVLSVVDHSNLNDVLENPTAERLAVWIWDKLKELPLHEVKLWESPTSFVTYNGE